MNMVLLYMDGKRRTDNLWYDGRFSTRPIHVHRIPQFLNLPVPVYSSMFNLPGCLRIAQWNRVICIYIWLHDSEEKALAIFHIISHILKLPKLFGLFC